MSRIRLINSANLDIHTGMEGTVEFTEYCEHKKILYVRWDNNAHTVLNVPPDQIEELEE